MEVESWVWEVRVGLAGAENLQVERQVLAEMVRWAAAQGAAWRVEEVEQPGG